MPVDELRKRFRYNYRRQKWQTEVLDVPANGNTPAHQTSRSLPDGEELVTVEIEFNLDAICRTMAARAAMAQRGVSKSWGGAIAAKVVHREPVVARSEGAA